MALTPPYKTKKPSIIVLRKYILYMEEGHPNEEQLNER